MNAPDDLEDGSDRLAEAARWRARLTEDGVESNVAFEEWMEDADNAAAWARVDGVWRDAGAAATHPDIIGARAAALLRAGRTPSSRFSQQARRIAALIAFIVLTAIGGYAAVEWSNRPDVYRTAAAERRVIELADGSSVSLDSSTELRVRFAAGRRDLELRSGQARFDVAHDADRPFVVTAGDHRITAIGTAFNVDLLGPSVLVTLIEGRVAVEESGRAPRPGVVDVQRPEPVALVLSPGEQARLAETTAPALTTVSITRTTAWETGQLIFEDEPLADAAARVSRYARRAIRTDGEAAALRVSGVFRTGDEATFLDAVTGYLPVAARAESDGSITLRMVPEHRG